MDRQSSNAMTLTDGLDGLVMRKWFLNRSIGKSNEYSEIAGDNGHKLEKPPPKNLWVFGIGNTSI